MADTLYDKISTLLAEARDEAYRDGYERGKADAKRELLAFLGARDGDVVNVAAATSVGNTDASGQDDVSARKRAPKGIVRKFVTRILNESPGLTPQKMPELATSEYERMIKVASIRSELRNGRVQGRYRDEHGHWYLVSSDEKDEAEGQSLASKPSASDDSSDGGESNAAALI